MWGQGREWKGDGRRKRGGKGGKEKTVREEQRPMEDHWKEE